MDVFEFQHNFYPHQFWLRNTKTLMLKGEQLVKKHLNHTPFSFFFLKKLPTMEAIMLLTQKQY